MKRVWLFNDTRYTAYFLQRRITESLLQEDRLDR